MRWSCFLLDDWQTDLLALASSEAAQLSVCAAQRFEAGGFETGQRFVQH